MRNQFHSYDFLEFSFGTIGKNKRAKNGRKSAENPFACFKFFKGKLINNKNVDFNCADNTFLKLKRRNHKKFEYPP